MWQISGLYTSTGIIPRPSTPPPTTFANRLLSGETDGFAIDATDVSAAPAYTGAPYAGYVSVVDTGTPAHNLSNVSLDSSNLLQSGTSPKMVLWNSSPYLRWTPHNIVIQSQTFNDAAWAKGHSTVSSNATTAPDGTSTADTLIEDSDVAQLHAASATTATGVSGFPYTVSVYVKAASGSRRLVLNLGDAAGFNGVYSVFDIAGAQVGVTSTAYGSGYTASGSPTISTVGSGWYRYEFAIISGGTELRMTCNLDNGSGTAALSQTYNGDGTSGLHLWGAQVNRGYTAGPYLATVASARIGIPQEYDTAASKFGILIEPAVTNLCLYSDDFTNAAWTKSNMTTAKTATGPDEAANSASTLTATAGNATALQAITSASSARITSMWVKRRTGTGNIDITQDNGTNWTTVTVTASWTRVGLAVASLTNPTVGIRIVTSGDAIDVFGFQHEIGSVVTSTIPTLGSTVTRAVDVLTAATSSFPHSGTANTWYVDFKTNANPNNANVLEVATDSNNRYNFWQDTNNDAFKLLNIDGGVNDVAISLGSESTGVRYQLSGSFKTNDFDGSLDGAAASSDGSGSLDGTLTTVYIGNYVGDTTAAINAYFYRIVQVPRQVETDANNIETWRYNF